MDALNLNVGSTQGDQSLARAKRLADLAANAEAGNAEVEQVSEEFSALLGTMLVKELRKALPDGFFGKGPGTDIMEGWMDEHIGRTLSDGWDLDIAGMVRVGLENAAEGEGDA